MKDNTTTLFEEATRVRTAHGVHTATQDDQQAISTALAHLLADTFRLS